MENWQPVLVGFAVGTLVGGWVVRSHMMGWLRDMNTRYREYALQAIAFHENRYKDLEKQYERLRAQKGQSFSMNNFLHPGN